MSRLIAEMHAEWKALDARIEALNGEVVEMARNDPVMRPLTTIPGVSVLNATALVATVGDGSTFVSECLLVKEASRNRSSSLDGFANSRSGCGRRWDELPCGRGSASGATPNSPFGLCARSG